MATPTNVNTTVLAGEKLRKGRFNPLYSSLMDQIAAAAPGTWFKANLNTINTVWPNADFSPGYANDTLAVNANIGSALSPIGVINAWSSFAWDDTSMRIVLFGGGHGNYSGSEVYAWNGTTKNWQLAFYSPQWEGRGALGAYPVGGELNGPISSHTYANQVWLEKQNKFISFGGACFNTGDSWRIGNPDGSINRPAGPYTLDMTLAGQGYVSMATGSNVKRPGTSSAGVDLPGANAWKLRDWFNTASPFNKTMLELFKDHRNGTAVHVIENNHDTIYALGSNGAGGSHQLYRIELVDDNPYNDLITVVGKVWNNGYTDQQCAYHEKRKLFMISVDRDIDVWDLNTAGANNISVRCPSANITGPDATEFKSVLRRLSYIYDERREAFIGWEFGRILWELKPPTSGALTTGWTVKKISSNSLPVGPISTAEATVSETSSGVHGKWKRSKKLDVYIGLQHNTQGNVWFFKPTDWIDQRGI